MTKLVGVNAAYRKEKDDDNLLPTIFENESYYYDDITENESQHYEEYSYHYDGDDSENGDYNYEFTREYIEKQIDYKQQLDDCRRDYIKKFQETV